MNNTINPLSISVIIVDWVYAHFVLGVEIMIIIHFANVVLGHTTATTHKKLIANLKDITLKVETQVKAFQVILELSRNLKITSVHENNTRHNLEEDHHQLVGDRVILKVTKELI